MEDQYIDEMGAGNGLRLQLRTASVQQAGLVLNGTAIRLTALPKEKLRGAWRVITLRFTPRGLSVRLDSLTLFADVPLPGFAPTATWRMAIGARCGALHDTQAIDDVRVSRGALLASGARPSTLP